MASQPSPSRRFQFRLRALMILFAVVAVILATLPLFTLPQTITAGPLVPTEFKHEDGQTVFVSSGIDADANWRLIAIAADASVIGLALWLFCRKR